MSAEARLADLGVRLPALRPKAGNYVGWYQVGSLLFLAGQGADGWVGRVGRDYTLEQGRRAARDCALNLLAQTRDALGTLDAVAGIVKVQGFVACTEGYDDLPAVVNGASDLLIEVFGERGRHARTALGVLHLPKGFAVEVEMIVEVASGGSGSRSGYRHQVP